MAGFAHDAEHGFWQSPALPGPTADGNLPHSNGVMAESCAQCKSEYMIGAKFCHACGLRRPPLAAAAANENSVHDRIAWKIAAIQPWIETGSHYWRKLSFPAWMQYLHFHEIKRWVGLPTASLIAFMVGLGCVAGALGVSFFYKASNVAEFQAIQMWRMEWLLAATASFVAGILLKTSSDRRSQ